MAADGTGAMSDMPVDGPGLSDFMPTLEVVEPDWVHERTPQTDVEPPLDVDATKEKIVDNLMLVEDPEIPVNIYDLGLIYDIDVVPEGRVRVTMTLTAPNCPVAGALPRMVQTAVMKVPGTQDCEIDLTFDPPWSQAKMSEDAKMALGLY